MWVKLFALFGMNLPRRASGCYLCDLFDMLVNLFS
jgi:hypothetical protein